MRSSICLVVACAAFACVPMRAAAQVDPNDPAQARTRYEAPVAQAAGSDIAGWPQASARERAGLGLLSVADQYQADLSRLALDRGLADPVHAWAERLLAEHAVARGRHDRWLPDLGQPRAQDGMRHSQRELAALRAAPPQDTTAHYVRAMSASLADTLHLLDHELIPAASNPEIKAYLQGLREPLAAELATARRLEAHGGAATGASP
jgi:predicted outer membrane protein